jgi:hypothetical protein
VLTKSGLPGWFPPDFKCAPALLEAFLPSAHAHANEAGGAVDLSAASLHVPAGSSNGGQFGTNSGGTAGKTPAQQHKLHQAHMAHLQRLVAQGKATPAQKAELARLTPKAPAAPKVAAVKAAVAKPKAAKVKATPGHPVVNKKKGTVTAVVNGKQVTMRLHEWHVIHVAHQQAVARQKAMKAGAKFAGDGSGTVIELVGPEGYTHGWVKVADGIEQTAGKIATGNDAKMGTSVRADRVTSFLHIAAKAARNGDHATALTMLGRARSDTLGSSARQRVPAVMTRDEGTAAKAIDRHIQAVTAAASPSAKPAAKVKKISAAQSRANRAAGLASDGDQFLDLAFAEALAERVPPGRPEGGRFVPAEPALGRYDTPAQTARAVNAMGPGQRAAVRVSTLPPPGFTWGTGDRLAVAKLPPAAAGVHMQNHSGRHREDKASHPGDEECQRENHPPHGSASRERGSPVMALRGRRR